MKFFKFSFILGISLALFPYSAGAYTGRYGGRILNINIYPGVAAVGDAYTARADNIAAVSVNPAGLSRIYGGEAIFAHTLYLLDTNLTAAAAAWRWGRLGVGFEWKQFLSRETYRDQWGHNKDSFDNKFTQLTMATGFYLSPRVSAGVSLKHITENLYEHSASAIAADAGLYILWFRGDTFAVTVRNIGGELEHESRGALPETALCLAGAHRMGDFILSWDILHSGELDIGWRAGLEAKVMDMLILRGGVKYEHSPDFSAGFGVPCGRWTFDYAFSPHRDLGGAHRMSLGAHF